MELLETLNVEEFDWSLDPKSLRNIYTKTDFDSIFVKLIAKDVIEILSPQLVTEPHNLVYDEELVYEHLIEPLEKFICDPDPVNAKQVEVKETLNYIRTLNQPSKLCRRIFKTGDVIFSCNDCGLDETCVVCIDCFHKGAHKDHNYRMSNSDGGGCCDCGDVEAWKKNYACSDHSILNQTNPSLTNFEDKELRSNHILADKRSILEKISRLPKGMATRYFLICQACLHYARTMLTWNNFSNMPENLQFDPENDDKLTKLMSKDTNSKNYFTVLFNDEVHTYDHVINTLVKVIKCTKMTASIMASTVSREGRSLVVNDKQQACKLIQDMITHSRDGGQSPLKVEIIHGNVLAHQAYALKLIEWIRDMSSISDAFRILTAYTLLGTNDKESELTLIETIMLKNTTFWKIARIEWNDLFVTTMLTEYNMKDQFARLITRNYRELMRDFIQDDHDHSVSILTMTTQLYTVPSLICMLIEEENALTIIMESLIHTCGNARRVNSVYSFENRNTFDMLGLKRALYIISDLRHLINIEPTKWTSQLRKNVIIAVKLFAHLLTSMQGMDSVRRQLGQHLEYEPDWESGMTLQGRLIALINRLVTYCSFDEEVLVSSLEVFEHKLKDCSYKMTNKELFGYQVSCIQYDVSTSPVSVHLPVTRFAAALIVELMKRRPCDKIPYDESLIILTESSDRHKKQSMVEIMEPSLRTEVMIAQYRSGMWRRNGYSLVNQLLYFHGALMRKEMFDRDILVLQECAAMCEANEFLIHLLNKFQLFIWVNSETTREPLKGSKAVSFHNDEEILTQTMSLGEEFLQLLLTIIGERYRVGVGIVEEDEVIQNEIIQLLCISPSTRSELSQKLNVNDNELDCIKAVANLRRSTESSTGKYELKDQYYDRFNPFFCHYSRRHQSNALDAQLKRKKNLNEPLICCPPPKPVELTRQFSNLNELLKSDILLIIIGKILVRALGPPEDAQECSTKAPIRFTASDLQLDQCLHLIGLGLYEQERSPTTFGYLQAAHDKGIFEKLRVCYDTAKRSKDLIFWLMKKTDALCKVMKSDHNNILDSETTEKIDLVSECFKSALATCDETKQDSRKRNSELAAQRRERIMAMMKVNQDKFLSSSSAKQLTIETEKNESKSKPSNASLNITTTQSNSNLTANYAASTPIYTTRSGRRSKPPKSICVTVSKNREKGSFSHVEQQASSLKVLNTSQTGETSMDYESEDQMDSESINMDEENNKKSKANEISHLCILCRDEQKVGFDQPTMVLLAFVQRSAVLSKNRKERRIPNYALTPSNQLKHQCKTKQSQESTIGASSDMYSFTSDNSWLFDATFMPSDLFFGPHISTCGHVMHYECWQGHFDAIIKRETSRPSRSTRHVSFELEKHELLCPLCECISNATIPLLPYYNNFALKPQQSDQLSTIFTSNPETIFKSSENLSACLHALRGAVDIYKSIRHTKEVKSFTIIENEDKYIYLHQPRNINDVLEELGEVEALGLRDFIKSIRSDKVSANSCTESLLRSISVLAERIHSIGLDLDPSVTDINHARIFMMTSWSISYTIQAYERTMRLKGTPIFDDLESPKNLCMSSLIRFACSSMLTHQTDMIQSLLVKKLRYLLINDEHLSSSPCCLDIDVFETFISLLILLQKLFAHLDATNQAQDLSNLGLSNKSISELNELLSASVDPTVRAKVDSDDSNYAWTTRAFDHEYFRNITHLMIILYSLQVIISIQNDLSTEDDEDTDDAQTISKEYTLLSNFYKEIILASGHPNNKTPKINEQFLVDFKSRLLPFLRSCAIFFYHLSHIEPPERLSTSFITKVEDKDSEIREEFVDAQQSFSAIESDKVDNPFIDPHADKINQEFSSICQYLSLPDELNLIYQCQEARHLARTWLRHSRVLVLIKSALKEKADLANKSTFSESTLKAQQPFKRTSSSSKSLATNPSSSSSSSFAELAQQQTELMPVKFIRQPHTVNRLIDLPYDYSELVDKVSDFSCPSIKNEDSRTPTMCLICGVMLCSQSYCCQRDLNALASNYQQLLQLRQDNRRSSAGTSNEALSAQQTGSGGGETGITSAAWMSYVQAILAFETNQATIAANVMNLHAAQATSSGSGASGSSSSLAIHQQLVGSCTYHAYECSGGIGVFLRIRNCQILLLSGRTKGCYMPAPYIDDHGETDFGLIRGNPLHLNREHYEKLQQMWLTHAIPEQVSRTLEYSPYASSINWHLH